jgi:hypothetical protein
MYVLVILGAAVAIGVYYLRYFSKLKAAGGRTAAGATYWREQFGLDADEHVVSMGIGTWYLGPLVPETMRSTGERILDAIGGVTYRGANMWVAFTSKNRLALAVEPTENGPRPAASSIGMPTGYAPLAIFAPTPAPRIETADQAWPGAADLPRDSHKPIRVNTEGRKARQELVRITGYDRQLTFFVEGDWVADLQRWSAGGAPRVDPRWTPAPAPTASPVPAA